MKELKIELWNRTDLENPMENPIHCKSHSLKIHLQYSKSHGNSRKIPWTSNFECQNSISWVRKLTSSQLPIINENLSLGGWESQKCPTKIRFENLSPSKLNGLWVAKQDGWSFLVLERCRLRRVASSARLCFFVGVLNTIQYGYFVVSILFFTSIGKEL